MIRRLACRGLTSHAPRWLVVLGTHRRDAEQALQAHSRAHQSPRCKSARVVCRFIDGGGSAVNVTDSGFFPDPTYDFGLEELAMGNVYIVIGTADNPAGELQGHAVEGWASA